MKSLQESLLDDEENLMTNTNMLKDFPNKDDVKGNLSEGYYRWKIPSNYTKKINYNFKYLYIRWRTTPEYWNSDNKSKPYNGVWSISFWQSNYSLQSPLPVVALYTTLGRDKTVNKQGHYMRDQCYELFKNIAINFKIFEYLLKFCGQSMKLDVFKDKFKKEWIEIK